MPTPTTPATTGGSQATTTTMPSSLAAVPASCRPRRGILARSLAAALVTTAAQAATWCPGSVDVAGYGPVHLTNAIINQPGDPAGDVLVQDSVIEARLKGRSYFADTCVNGEYNLNRYVAWQLLGRTLRYTTDLAGAGCGCNAALYLVSMPQNDRPSGCADYYCDANSVCGERCAEVDLQEANLHSWHSTLHAAADGSGVPGGFGGNGARDWTAADFAPGASCIDSSRPIDVEISFPIDPATGVLRAMELRLSQPGSSCTVGGVVGQDYHGLAEVSAALAAGMTPVISYWSADDMLWLDGQGHDRQGFCERDVPERCAESVRFYNFSIQGLDPGVPPAAAPASSPTSAPAEHDAARSVAVVGGGADDADEEEGSFEFSGFASPSNARLMCPPGSRLAAPRTPAQARALARGVERAVASGRMERTWPRDTIWLGGRWSNARRRWEWDDGEEVGSTLPWATDLTTAEWAHSAKPMLCMVDGQMRDSESVFLFGVMCERLPAVNQTGACCLAGDSCGGCSHFIGQESWCGLSASNCASCGGVGTWCPGASPTSFNSMALLMQKNDAEAAPRLPRGGGVPGGAYAVAAAATVLGLVAVVLATATVSRPRRWQREGAGHLRLEVEELEETRFQEVL